MIKQPSTLMSGLLAGLLVTGVGYTGSAAHAAEWPTDNIRMVLPFGAGGSIDRYARGIAQHWEEHLDGQAVIVDNRPGASGLLGARTFLGAEPDGHTLFVGLQPTLSMNIVVQGADFDLDEFVFVNIEQRDFASITVRADSPYETIEDLVEDIRARPGEVSLSMAPGAGTHLFGLAFVDSLELEPNIVLFDGGGGEQRTDLLGGHSDAAVSSAYGDMTLGDQVRVLAVSSEDTFSGWPDAAPINQAFPEANLPAIGDNRFIAVHRSFVENHPEKFDRIVESYREVFESEKYQEYTRELGSDIISGYLGPDESMEVIRQLHDVVLQFEDVLSGD